MSVFPWLYAFASIAGVLHAEDPEQPCNFEYDFDTGVPGNAHFVDAYKGNLLMRMSWPAVNTRACIERVLKLAAGERWPEGKYELYDVSLSDEMGERELFGDKLLPYKSRFDQMREAFKRECKRFDSTFNCPASMQPKDVPSDMRKHLANNFDQWDLDHLEAHVTRVRNLLLQSDGPRRVIFFHCASGKDRTGEFAAAYSMRFMHMSMAQATTRNVQIARRPTIYSLQVNAQWYCESLSTRGLYHYHDCASCVTFTSDMLSAKNSTHGLLSCQDEIFEHKPALSTRCQSIIAQFYVPMCSDGPDVPTMGDAGVPTDMMDIPAHGHRAVLALCFFVGLVSAAVVILRRSKATTSAQVPLIG